MNIRVSAVLLAPVAVIGLVASLAAQQNPYLGRWNITGTGENAANVYWLEVTSEGGQVAGRLLNRGGSPVKLPTIRIENGELVFQPAAPRSGTAPEFRVRAQGDRLTGTVANGGKTIQLAGVRPPKWGPADANAKHALGKPVDLFDGKSMDAWDVQDKAKPMGWTVVDGTMTNTPSANNLVSKQKFQDYQIHAEYKVEKNSNSGIYIRGRYELQVLDDFGKPPEEHSHMSVYAWHAPLVNASKPVGEWQTMDATIVGNKVTVVLNGKKVQDNATLEAITGGALDANESEPGPVMIQGDHEKITYRKVTVTPITDTRK
jgi:3-keto-disaccharide hydrolase